MGHVGPKTKSLGQILEKPCVYCRGHIFSLIIINSGQNVCLDESRMSLKMGHVESTTRSPSQILEKPCVGSKGHILSNYHET